MMSEVPCPRCQPDLPIPLNARSINICRACRLAKLRESRRKPKGQFTCARDGARQRGTPFHLTQEEYAALRLLPCHYCRGPLPETGVGLDRLDNSGNYSADNVVSCCTACNLGRNTLFTPDEMLVIGAVIAEIWSVRQAQGISCTHTSGWGAGAPRKYQTST